jgi:hypothetical protein
MEVLVSRELLAQQARATHAPAGVNDQAAVGFVAEERLPDSKHDQWIHSTTHNRERQSGHDRAANFSKERFHNFKQV